MPNGSMTLENTSAAYPSAPQTNPKLPRTRANRKGSEPAKISTPATYKMPLWLKFLIGTIILALATFAVLALVFSTAGVSLIPIVFAGLANIHNALVFAGIITGSVLLLGTGTTGIVALATYAPAEPGSLLKPAVTDSSANTTEMAESLRRSEQAATQAKASPLRRLSQVNPGSDADIDTDTPTPAEHQAPPYSRHASAENLQVLARASSLEGRG